MGVFVWLDLLLLAEPYLGDRNAVYKPVSRADITRALLHLRELYRAEPPRSAADVLAQDRREAGTKTLLSNLARTTEHPTLHTLLEIASMYSLTLDAVHRLFGYDLDQLRALDRTLNGGRTRIIESYAFERDFPIDLPSQLSSEQAFTADATLRELVLEWQRNVPIRALDGHAWRKPGSFYAQVGTEDSLGSSLPPGAIAHVEPVSTEEQERPNPRRIYFLQFGNGYRCSRCVVTRGKLLLITTDRHFRGPQQFVYPGAVRIVGRVRMCALSLPTPDTPRLRSLPRFTAGAPLVLPWEHTSMANLFETEHQRFRQPSEYYHVDTAFAKRTFELHDSSNGIYRIPGADSSSFELERTFHETVWSRGYRSILSGIGGDELTGGVPSPLPELAGYAVAGNLRKLLGQALAWAIADRSTLAITLWQTATYLTRLYGTRSGNSRGVPPWLSSDFAREFVGTATDSLSIRKRFGLAPHQVDNIRSWQWIMETLPHQFPGLLFRPEYRYPFLDKDLVHFLWNIPRDQLLRPGRRRSLMRRALVGIVPHEVLERRLKAFQLSAPLKKVAETESLLCALFRDSILARQGYIDPTLLGTWIQRTAAGDPTWWQALLKTISLELWLQGHESQKPGIAEDWALTTALDFGRDQPADKIRRLQHSC